MPLTTKRSENVTNIETSPITVLDKKVGQLNVAIDQVAIVSADIDTAGDIILLAPVPSNAVIIDIELVCDDIDASGVPTLSHDVGLYYSGIGGSQTEDGNVSGTVIDADAFASAVTTLQAKVTTWTSVRFESATANIINLDKEAWELGGLTADPGGLLYIGMTMISGAGTPAAGDIGMKVSYI